MKQLGSRRCHTDPGVMPLNEEDFLGKDLDALSCLYVRVPEMVTLVEFAASLSFDLDKDHISPVLLELEASPHLSFSEKSFRLQVASSRQQKHRSDFKVMLMLWKNEEFVRQEIIAYNSSLSKRI